MECAQTKIGRFSTYLLSKEAPPSVGADGPENFLDLQSFRLAKKQLFFLQVYQNLNRLTL